MDMCGFVYTCALVCMKSKRSEEEVRRRIMAKRREKEERHEG